MSKLSILIPPDTHQALRSLAFADPTHSISSLCREVMDSVFGEGLPSPGELATIEPSEGERWPRVSIYARDKVKRRAAKEVQRKLGSEQDRRVGSVAKVVAWLVNRRYHPGLRSAAA